MMAQIILECLSKNHGSSLFFSSLGFENEYIPLHIYCNSRLRLESGLQTSSQLASFDYFDTLNSYTR